MTENFMQIRLWLRNFNVARAKIIHRKEVLQNMAIILLGKLIKSSYKSAVNYKPFNHWKSNIRNWRCQISGRRWCLKNTMRKQISRNSSTGKFGDGFGPLWDRMLGKLTGQCQTHCRLNLTRRDCWFLVVAGQTRSFLRQLLEDIVNEGVHDPHSLGRNSSIWMHLNNRQKPTITPPRGY